MKQLKNYHAKIEFYNEWHKMNILNNIYFNNNILLCCLREKQTS